MPFNFLAQLLVGIVLSVISFIMTPRPKTSKPAEVKDLESPTAEAGRPQPVIFGTVPIDSANVLWFGQKSAKKVSVSGGGKKG